MKLFLSKSKLFEIFILIKGQTASVPLKETQNTNKEPNSMANLKMLLKIRTRLPAPSGYKVV